MPKEATARTWLLITAYKKDFCCALTAVHYYLKIGNLFPELFFPVR